MTDLPELLPCPFCGGQPTLHEARRPLGSMFMASCTQCECCLAQNRSEEAAAITAWNTRVPLSAKLAVARRMAIEDAAMVLTRRCDALADSRSPYDGTAYAEMEMARSEIRALPSPGISTVVERAAEAVHVAYLETARRLGWPIKAECDKPYCDLSDDAKELDRATARAVIKAIMGE